MFSTQSYPILNIQDVSFQYTSKSSFIIQNLSLQLYAGQSIAIIGRSGAGKSTLMHLIYGHLMSFTGVIEIFGSNIKHIQQHLIRRRIGMITQFDTLLYNFSIIENVAMPLIIQGMHSSDANISAINALHDVGLHDYITHDVSQLSGGQKKRVMVARAIAHKPELILADEATGDLDHNTADSILDLILASSRLRDIGLLWITHDMRKLCVFDYTVEI
jgi:lipoprotein-releasing system ATP-binding protein